MEILAPSSYFSNPSWFLEESISTKKWTAAENKAFENALALFDENTPNRWERVAERVPGKTVDDVIRQYKELEDDVSSIEAGLVPVPGYSTSSSYSSPFTLEWGSSGHGFDGFKQSFGVGGRKPPPGRPNEHERKKGVPWTEEEHKLFLLGLKKYGKGDWRNISRNYVITRTPTQVASHAQKYFIRQLSGGKDKRRASIHDITTVSLHDNQNVSPDSKRTSPGDQPLTKQANTTTIDNKTSYQWNQTNNETIMGFDSGTILGNNTYGMSSYEVKMQGVHDLVFGSPNMVFQMQSGFHYNA